MSLVFVTGAAGEIGRGVIPLLRDQFQFRLLDRAAPAEENWIQADILDGQALASAMRGVDAVLHLAVASGHAGPFEDDAFNDTRFDINVKGTFHVFEAARLAGVKRVVHVSSLMVVWGYGHERTVAGDVPARPIGTYALTKALSEDIARYYAERFGLEVITLRIAAPLDIDVPDLKGKRVRPQQVPFPDLAQAFAKALTMPLDRYEVVTIVGESSRRTWDLEPARRVLGYVPQFRLDDLGVVFDEPFAVASA